MSNTPPKLPIFYSDADVREFAAYYALLSSQETEFNLFRHFETWKQSKQSAPEPSALPNKEWEIVSLHHKNDSINKLILSDKKDCYYWSGGELNKNPLSIDYVLSKQDFVIYSVRRLQDGVVFSVGDKVYYDTNDKNDVQPNIIHWDIDHFLIRDDGVMLAISKDCGNVETIDHWCHLKHSSEKLPITDHPTQPVVEDNVFTPTQQKEIQNIIFNQTVYKPKDKVASNKDVLFTTEDGVGIIDKNKEIYLVDKRIFTLNTTNANHLNFNKKYYSGVYHIFSTKEAAERYILDNKPCLSLNDLLEAWNGGFNPNFYRSAPLFKNFQQKAKEKLKG